MFYVKTQPAYGVTVKTEITDENVFTDCPSCGAEVAIDLTEMFGDGECDLFGTAVYCTGCSERRARKKPGFDAPPTFDGLSWLTGILRNAGYAELIDGLFVEYGIGSLRSLPEERYRAFGDDLADMACGAAED